MTTNPKNPRTPGEWQEAADGAKAMLTIDAARQYGLIEGGRSATRRGASRSCERRNSEGIVPLTDCIDRAFGGQADQPG